ncbi:SPW repeat domain-containing protein [Kribbella deserti]|uniref:SPW repeat protein n=1 Tax=Kribbella deserti TaxID=1926257 RepID=A0ABV6QF82_9ACTN
MRVISSRTHTFIGLVVGLLLLVAPWLFAFADENAPKSVAVVVGAFVLINEMITTSPVSPLRLVPMGVHLVIDIVTGAFLILSPWLFQFADRGANAWLPHVVVGLLTAGYAFLTNPADATKPTAAERI